MKSCPVCGRQDLADDLGECPDCASPFQGNVVDYQALTAGSLLKDGEYEIIELLGRGGFAFTYLARQRSLGREVAVKELFSNNSELSQRVPGSSQVISRHPREFDLLRQDFQREAERLCALEHPDIVRVYDRFTDNGTEYLVMERVEGKSLERWRMEDGSQFKPNQLRRHIEPLFEAVAWLHAQGLVHRDINPRNIMVREDGRPVLIDFGLARHIGSQAGSRSVMAATDGYAPPEQYFEENPRGTAIDIYALGAVLYFLVRGEPPPPALQRKGNNARLRWPRGISRKLKDEIERAMVLDVKERPSTVEEWLTCSDQKSEKKDNKSGKNKVEVNNGKAQNNAKKHHDGKESGYDSVYWDAKSPKQRMEVEAKKSQGLEESSRMVFWAVLCVGVSGAFGYLVRLF